MDSEPFDGSDDDGCRKLVKKLAQEDGKLVSPIDLALDMTTPLDLDRLQWVNLDNDPSIMKLTNTGDTAIVSGKWALPRPYLTGGPLDGNYVFSQVHFHWGANEHEGSEHTVRGVSYPMEMHVVFFKTRYLTQEAALKHDDGMIIVVYLVKLQNRPTPGLQWLSSQLPKVIQPRTSTMLNPSPLSALLVPFAQDYLMYCGALSTQHCSHTMMWLVSRSALAITTQELEMFRKLRNCQKQALTKNFRGGNPPMERSIFHVCPSADTSHVLLPGTASPPGQVLVVGYSKVSGLDHSQAVKVFSRGDGSDDNSERKSDHKDKITLVKCNSKMKEHDEIVDKVIVPRNIKTTTKLNSKTSNEVQRVSTMVPKNIKVRNVVQRVKLEKKDHVMMRKRLERQRKDPYGGEKPTTQCTGLSAATVKRLQERIASRGEEERVGQEDSCVHTKSRSTEPVPTRPLARSKMSVSNSTNKEASEAVATTLKSSPVTNFTPTPPQRPATSKIPRHTSSAGKRNSRCKSLSTPGA